MKKIPAGNLAPNKSLGQNFLVNEHVQNKIIESCKLDNTETVLEIGPGKGALTEKILPSVKELIAVEKDSRMADFLNKNFPNESLKVYCKDFLEFPLTQLPKNKKIKVIGNLPYNVATPIIEKIILNRKLFTSFYMTVQLEYGQRICAKENSKAYGSLSCFIQLYSDTKFLFRIKNTAFFPKPKVESCFLKLSLLDKPKFAVENESSLFKLIKTAFSQRRKTILNSLSNIAEKEILLEIFKKAGINQKLRAENISLEQFTRIANLIKSD